MVSRDAYNGLKFIAFRAKKYSNGLYDTPIFNASVLFTNQIYSFIIVFFFYHNLDKSKAGCIALVVSWATNFIGYLFVIRVVKRFFVACKKYKTTFDIDINIDIYISRYSDNTGGRGGDAEGGIGKIIVALVFSSSYISHHLRYIAYSYMFLCLYKLFLHV